jgi:hypothetical protein
LRTDARLKQWVDYMRLWSIHPRYLDWMGLGAEWREGLLAQAVLEGRTKGWKHHPQLDRFKDHPKPLDAIGFYLVKVNEEAMSRGYSYDISKITRPAENVENTPITRGQLLFEFGLLYERTRTRTPAWHAKLRESEMPDPHPLFFVVEGEPGGWETSYWRGGSALKDITASHQSDAENNLFSS